MYEQSPIEMQLEMLRYRKHLLEDPIREPLEYVVKFFGICEQEMRVNAFAVVYLTDEQGTPQPAPSDYHGRAPLTQQPMPFLTCELCMQRIAQRAFDDIGQRSHEVQAYFQWLSQFSMYDFMRMRGVKCGYLRSRESVLSLNRDRVPEALLFEMDTLNSQQHQRHVFVEEVLLPTQQNLDAVRVQLDQCIMQMRTYRDTSAAQQVRQHPLMSGLIPDDARLDEYVEIATRELDFLAEAAIPQLNSMVEDLKNN